MQSAKRLAEDFARVNHQHSPASKKPRFDLRNPSALAPDALEEDAVLSADVIGHRGQQVRRGAVNVDGYDSDSDNENFDNRAAAKAKNEKVKTKAEEENDMFTDLAGDFADGDDSEGDADRRGGTKKGKNVRFLNEDEIEGQVANSKSGGHVSADFRLNNSKGEAVGDEVESSSDSEVDDATRADVGDVDEELGAGGKKTHAPKLDAFNMRNENDEGKFDDQGNFVRKATDADAIHDIWLEGISKKEMKKASEAHEKRENERRKKDIEDDAKTDDLILSQLLPLLQPAESVLEALARLNKSAAPKPKKQPKKKRAADNMEVDETEKVNSEEQNRKNAIDTITEAADLLLARGQNDIYDTEKELLIRQFQRITGTEWSEPSQDTTSTDTKSWQYRWSDARDGGDIHGPYDTATMQAWNQAGYFGDGVEFRQLDSAEWSRTADFV